MKIRKQKGAARAPMIAVATVLCGHAFADETRVSTDEDWLHEVIVTAPRMQSPLLLMLDAKAPRQPLPAHDGADYLKTVPGFAVIRKGGTDGDPVFRGMAASRVNLQLDGEQILGGCGMRMDPPTAYVFPESYDRIVVIKGPQTVLHGPGNSAATVLFERDPPDFKQGQWRLHSSGLAASADRSDFVSELLLGNESFYGRVSGTRAEAEDYEDGAGRTVHSSYMRWSANAELGWTPDENTRVALTAAQSDGEAAYADRTMDGVMFARDNVGLRFEREYGGGRLRKIEAQVFYNYVDHVMDNYSLRTFTSSTMMPNQTVSNPDRETIGGRLAVELGRERGLRAMIGLDAQENVHTIRSTSDQGRMPYQALRRVEDGRFRDAGAFAEITWPLSDAQRVVSGVRFDYWDAKDSRATLPLGMSAVRNPTAGEERSTLLTSGFGRWETDVAALNATLYAGIGHVERFPDYWELLSAGRESVESVSAFDTRPEKTTQLDTGLIYRSSRLSLSLAAFYNQIDDYILVQSAYQKGVRLISVTRNVDASTFGAEADAAYALGDGWKLTAALAYTRGDNATDNVPLAQLPPLEARLGIAYERGAWSVGSLARWVADQERFALNQGNIVGQDLGRSDGFTTLAINAAWRPMRGVLLSAGIDNLFDRLYAEHMSRGGAMLAGYTQTTRVNEPGRTLWLRMSGDFK